MVWSLLFIYSQVFQDNKKVSYTTSNCIWERRAKGCVLLCVADHTFGTLTKGKHALNCWKLHRKAQDLFCSLDQLLLLFPAPSFLTEKISSCENSLPNANDTVLLNSQPSRQGKKKKKKPVEPDPNVSQVTETPIDFSGLWIKNWKKLYHHLIVLMENIFLMPNNHLHTSNLCKKAHNDILILSLKCAHLVWLAHPFK